jgi:hypothetical protein
MTGTTVRVTLMPRDIPARSYATCSDVSLSVDVTYETVQPPSGTGIQRRIEAMVRLHDEAWSVSIGGLELTFDGGNRLCSLSLYADFTAAASEELPLTQNLEPVWLTLPEFDPEEDDRFGMEASVRVSINRQRDTILVQLTDAGSNHRACSLADGLVAWVDSADCLAGLVIHGVCWTTSTPVGAVN